MGESLENRVNALELEFKVKTKRYDEYMGEIGQLVLSLSKNVQLLNHMQENEVVVFKKNYRELMKQLSRLYLYRKRKKNKSIQTL